jgi:predicted dehydrogenase
MRAAVIGLGKIGNLFDADPKRQDTWSHAGAYEKAEGIALTAGADPDLSAREAFLSCRANTSAYADYRDMLERERPDIVSICTPPAMHAEMVLCAVDAGVRGVFCEKPLAASLGDARRIVETCRMRDVRLAVNHTRRWDREWLWPKALIAQGSIGTVQVITGWYYGGALNLCSHLIDTIHLLTGGLATAASCAVSRGAGGDPGVSGVLDLGPTMTARIACADGDRDLWFEIDLAGTEGRLRILDNGSNLELYQWAPSERYSGYRELAAVPCANLLPPQNRFVDAVRDLMSCVEQRRQPACSGEDGFAALAAVVALKESAAAGGARVSIAPTLQEEETS